MRKPGKIKGFFLVLLAGLFVVTISAREVHYIFVSHDQHVHEHCDNHLHATNHHHHPCQVCKLDISSFLKSEEQVVVNFISSSAIFFNSLYSGPSLNGLLNTPSLRGPPSTTV